MIGGGLGILHTWFEREGIEKRFDAFSQRRRRGGGEASDLAAEIRVLKVSAQRLHFFLSL